MESNYTTKQTIMDIYDKLKEYEGESLITFGNFLVKTGSALIEKGQTIQSNAEARRKSRANQSSINSDTRHSGTQSPERFIHREDSSQKITKANRETYGSVPEVLLLFLKADDPLIQKVRNLKKLNSENDESLPEELYMNTLNLWQGSEYEFKTRFSESFNNPEKRGVTPSLDFVIVKIGIKKNYLGFRKGQVSPIDRMEGFKQLCEDKVEILAFSNRQNFENTNLGNFTWEK